MDLSNLERHVKSLEASLDRVESWLLASTLLVVVGLLIEYWYPLGEFLEAVLRKPFPWKKLFELTGGVLVTVGVAGELCFQFSASSKETSIRTDSHLIEGVLNSRASDAEERAGKAVERAAKADLARAQLEASLRWRRLSKKQGNTLCSAIPKYLARQVVVTSSSGDPEAWRYAIDFSKALQRCITSAGLPSDGTGVGNILFWGQNIAFGVWIRFQKHLKEDDLKSTDTAINPAKRQALAISIRKALEESGVKVAGLSEDGRGLIDIYVGPRSLPPPEDADDTPNKKN
jgi:hypothetical protein